MKNNSNKKILLAVPMLIAITVLPAYASAVNLGADVNVSLEKNKENKGEGEDRNEDREDYNKTYLKSSTSVDGKWDIDDLPKGIEKRLESGKELPPGIWKKFFGKFFKDELKQNVNLTIKAVDVVAGTSTATIKFETKATSTATVYYGKNKELNTSSSAVVSTNASATHAINLVGLESDTRYYYKIVVKDGNNNTKDSGVMRFTTEDVGDTEDPDIVYMTTMNITDDSVTVFWVTDERTRGKVWVNTNTPDTSAPAGVTLTEYSYIHYATVSNLNATTTYKFVVQSEDKAGNVEFSGESSFVTK